MADAVDYQNLTSAMNNLLASNNSLATSLNNSFGSNLTTAINNALNKFTGNNKNQLEVHDKYLSGIFNSEFVNRDKQKTSSLQSISSIIKDKIDVKLSSLGINNLVSDIKGIASTVTTFVQDKQDTTKFYETVTKSIETINDSITSIKDLLNNSLGQPNNNNQGSNNLPTPGSLRGPKSFYEATLNYLKDISENQKKMIGARPNDTRALIDGLGTVIGGVIGTYFGGGPIGTAAGALIGNKAAHLVDKLLERLSDTLENLVVKLFSPSTYTKLISEIAKLAYNAMKKALSVITAPFRWVASAIKGTISKAWNGIKTVVSGIWSGIKTGLSKVTGGLASLGLALSRIGTQAYEFFKKVTPFNTIVNTLSGYLQSLVDLVSMIVGQPANAAKERVEITYRFLDQMEGQINEVMGRYGVSMEEASSMIIDTTAKMKPLPYVYLDAYEIQTNINQEFISLLESTSISAKQAKELAPILEKYKDFSLLGINFADTVMIKQGSKIYNDLGSMTDSYASMLNNMQNSMNVNIQEVHSAVQQNMDYFLMTTESQEEFTDKILENAKAVGKLNSTVIDTNKLINMVNSNRDKLAKDFFSSDLGKTVLLNTSDPWAVKKAFDTRQDAEGLTQVINGIFRNLTYAGITPKNLHEEWALATAQSYAPGIDMDLIRQILNKEITTGRQFQEAQERAGMSRFEAKKRTMEENYINAFNKSHLFVGSDSLKIMKVIDSWSSGDLIKKFKDYFGTKVTLGLDANQFSKLEANSAAFTAIFSLDFKKTILKFMSDSIVLANDMFYLLVNFTGLAGSFINNLVAHGLDMFTPGSTGHKAFIDDSAKYAAGIMTMTKYASEDTGNLMTSTSSLLNGISEELEKLPSQMEEYYGKMGKSLPKDATDDIGSIISAITTSANRIKDIKSNPEYTIAMSNYKKNMREGKDVLEVWIEPLTKAITQGLNNSSISKSIESWKQSFDSYKVGLESFLGIAAGAGIGGAVGGPLGAVIGGAVGAVAVHVISPIIEPLIRYVSSIEQNVLQESALKRFGLDKIKDPEERYRKAKEFSDLARANRIADEERGIIHRGGTFYYNEKGQPSWKWDSSINSSNNINKENTNNIIESSKEDANRVAKKSEENTKEVVHTTKEVNTNVSDNFKVNQELLKDSGDTLVDIRNILKSIYTPASTHFNKFNNNLSGKLNTYLSEMIKFIDEEKKAIEEERKAALEGKKPNSEDTVEPVGDGYGGYRGSVFSESLIPKGGGYKVWREPNGFSGAHYHNGIDYGVPAGTPLPATENAVVKDVEYNPYKGNGYGRLVILEGLDSGLFVGYAHLQKPTVQIGDKIKKGQIIGYSGTSGDAGDNSFPDHLHFMVGTDPNFYGINGTMNPLDYLKGRNIRVISGSPSSRRRGTRGRFLSRLPGFGMLGQLGRENPSNLNDIISLAVGSESAGNIAVVGINPGGDIGYGKFQITTFGSMDNWGAFVKWLSSNPAYSVLYDRLKNTSGYDPSGTGAALQELATSNYRLLDQAQNKYAIKTWLDPLGPRVTSRSNRFKSAAFSFSLNKGKGGAYEILEKSGALDNPNDDSALVQLYRYALKHHRYGGAGVDYAGRYYNEAKKLGIYNTLINEGGGNPDYTTYSIGYVPSDRARVDTSFVAIDPSKHGFSSIDKNEEFIRNIASNNNYITEEDKISINQSANEATPSDQQTTTATPTIPKTTSKSSSQTMKKVASQSSSKSSYFDRDLILALDKCTNAINNNRVSTEKLTNVNSSLSSNISKLNSNNTNVSCSYSSNKSNIGSNNIATKI